MELFQWGTNPWGQEVAIRLSWDLLYVFATLGIVFVIGHMIFRKVYPERPDGEPTSEELKGLPERVTRHSLAARLFHWVMAASMLVLLFSAFLPIVGVQFNWLVWHWVAGIALIISVLYHIVHAVFFQDLWSVWISPSDVKEGMQDLKHMMGSGPAPEKPGKYPFANKAYHAAVLVTTLAVIVTGILMLYRIQTPLVTRNPYLLSDQSWGVTYVLHGLAGVVMVFLVIAHIYFAVLPEKRWQTWSMIRGWISKKDYATYHDRRRWALRD